MIIPADEVRRIQNDINYYKNKEKVSAAIKAAALNNKKGIVYHVTDCNIDQVKTLEIELVGAGYVTNIRDNYYIEINW